MSSISYILRATIPSEYNPQYPDEFWGIIDAISQQEPETWEEADDHFEEYIKCLQNHYFHFGDPVEWEETEYEYREKWDTLVENNNTTD